MNKFLALLFTIGLVGIFSACGTLGKTESGVQTASGVGSSSSAVSAESSEGRTSSAAPSVGSDVTMEQMRSKTTAKIAEITNSSMSQLQKAKYCYEWIFYHFKYRAQAVDLSAGYTDQLCAQLINTFYKTQKGSCEHYAVVEKIFLEQLGLPCQLVEGERYDSSAGTWGEHVWVMVQIDGAYYHVDGLFGGNHTASLTSMFCVPDRALEKTHRWDRSKYPVCDRPQIEV